MQKKRGSNIQRGQNKICWLIYAYIGYALVQIFILLLHSSLANEKGLKKQGPDIKVLKVGLNIKVFIK